MGARGLIRCGLAALLIATAGAAPAQEPPVPSPPPVRSPVLTVESDRLFTESLFGQRVLAELGAATDALAAENRIIESRLTEEERSLTERRPSLSVAAFRDEAEAFDARVQDIRREQDTKERDLQLVLTRGREAFLAAATPVLGQVMIDHGAYVILDRRTVFLGVAVVDITSEALVAIDAAIGTGLPAAPAPADPPGQP